MQIQRWVLTTLQTITLTSTASLGLIACDTDDEGDDELAEAGDSEGDETLGRTDGDVGESEGGETLGRTDGDVGESGGVEDGPDDFGDGAETAEPTGCVAYESEAACNAEPGCAAVLGNALVEDGEGGWCSASEPEFIGCVATGNLCPPLMKVLCGGDDQMWTTTDCVPDDLDVCEPPQGFSGTCA